MRTDRRIEDRRTAWKSIRGAWKWFSVQAMTLAIVIQAAYLVLDDKQKESINVRYVTIGVLVLGIIGRFRKQEDRHAKNKINPQ